jgi:hypothetical protein
MIPPCEDRVRTLSLDSSSTHLSAARDCTDPVLSLAALALSVCPERAQNEAVKGRLLLLKAVAVLTGFGKNLSVVPTTLAGLKEPEELVSFSERLFRCGKKFGQGWRRDSLNRNFFPNAGLYSIFLS